jgi:hypothetical protein
MADIDREIQDKLKGAIKTTLKVFAAVVGAAAVKELVLRQWGKSRKGKETTHTDN